MLPFRYCCISLSGNCEGRGDKRRRGEGRGGEKKEGGEKRGRGGARFVCFHMCELASFSGSFPVMISGEDLGNNASVNYPPLLPPA